MRLLVAGGRHLNDVARITTSLNLIHARHAISVLIHGGHAFWGVTIEDWARERGLHVLRYPANWRVFGRRAEGIRNDFMLADSRPDMLLALPGGEDTRALVLSAVARGVPVLDQERHRITETAVSPGEGDPEPEPVAPLTWHPARVRQSAAPF